MLWCKETNNNIIFFRRNYFASYFQPDWDNLINVKKVPRK